MPLPNEKQKKAPAKESTVDDDKQDEIYALTGKEDPNKQSEIYALTGHMSNGGEVPPAPQTNDLEGIRELLRKASEEHKSPKKDGPEITLTKPDLDTPDKTAKGVFVTQRFAEGGIVDPSDEEKQEAVRKAMSEGKLNMADGGEVGPTQLPDDAPQENKLQAILRAIGMAGSGAVSSVLPGTQSLAGAVAPAAASAASTPGVAPAINSALGTKLEDSSAMPTTPPAMAASPHVPAPVIPPAAAPHMPKAPSMASTPDPLAQLGHGDVSMPGMEAQDRQALAGKMDEGQHTFGNYLAQAVAGIGDAVAARGGVNQNALGEIFNMQGQRRHEALENFDKARQSAVDHFNMKNQADRQLIENLKARNEMYVSPGIAASIGHPELANKPVSHAELVIKTDALKYEHATKMMERKQSALKNAAEDVDKAQAHGGLLGTQKWTDPNARLKMIHAQAIKNDPEAFGYTITQGK